MRTTNPEKIKAIKQAVINSCKDYGLLDMTTAKIAKAANVSPATIYIHYQDKKDLLSRLYEEVKAHLQSGMDEVIDDNATIDDQVHAIIEFSIKQYHKFPDEFNFIRVLWNNHELLDEHAIQFEKRLNGSLQHLFDRIDSSPNYVNVSQTTLDVFFSVPILVLNQDTKVNSDEVQQIVNMVINAIKK
ncbi:TetR/AcrR family transcriptional regulator [Nicoliella lavandulae]|uniref:TetR/AcrR family transcriptional regulator n=1 Tax=Nicoliella lavandulae TaxID=3082954 RepID=A0ABU8SMI2_9LACO